MANWAKNVIAAGLSVLAMAGAGRADPGHGVRLVVDLGADRRLTISNFGAQPVVVMGVGLPGAGPDPLARPVAVGPGELAVGLNSGVSATPGQTLLLDLGPDGILPVLLPR